MGVYLNSYGLVAFTSDQPLTLDEACTSLGIRVDMGDEEVLRDALRGLENRVGTYNSCLLLCTDNELQFFDQPLCDLSERLLRAFPRGKGCAVYYYSSPGLYGYAYFENGKVLRAKHGELDKVWVDLGGVLTCEGPAWSFTRTTERLVGIVTGDELPELAGKEIPMFRFELMDKA